MKEQVIKLAKQAGIRWDTDIDRSEWLVRRSELENLVALVRNAALEEAAQTCESQAGIININGANGCYQECAAAIRNMKDNT